MFLKTKSAAYTFLQELNSAIEFTSVYETLLPIVQTLPQLVLHKEKIIGTLLSNLKLSAIHSLPPILRYRYFRSVVGSEIGSISKNSPAFCISSSQSNGNHISRSEGGFHPVSVYR
jgi:hypothetical protein